MWRFSFFSGNFPKWSLHHVCFHGGIFNGFSSQKINKIQIKLAALRLCVCLSWFKETRGLPSVRRSRVPTSIRYNNDDVHWGWPCMVWLAILLLVKVVLNDTCTFENMNRTNTQLNTHNVFQKMSLLELIRSECFLEELSSLCVVFFIKWMTRLSWSYTSFFYIAGSLGWQF
jgi:hypothetical protein